MATIQQSELSNQSQSLLGDAVSPTMAAIVQTEYGAPEVLSLID